MGISSSRVHQLLGSEESREIPQWLSQRRGQETAPSRGHSDLQAHLAGERDALRRCHEWLERLEHGERVIVSDPPLKGVGFATNPPCGGLRLLGPAYTGPSLSAQARPLGRAAWVLLSWGSLAGVPMSTSLCVQSAFSSTASPCPPGILLPRPIPTERVYQESGRVPILAHELDQNSSQG
jgi:hypothetical protein